jgi:hypothetical protein
VATETNARIDRWRAPRHSDRPAKPTLLRQATRISTRKSTRRIADLDEVTVGIAEEHADPVVCRNSAHSKCELFRDLRIRPSLRLGLPRLGWTHPRANGCDAGRGADASGRDSHSSWYDILGRVKRSGTHRDPRAGFGEHKPLLFESSSRRVRLTVHCDSQFEARGTPVLR